jgi:hypothetical protein
MMAVNRSLTGLTRRLVRFAVSVALVVLTSGSVAADGDPPPLPEVFSTVSSVDIPAAPESVDAVLLDQMVVDPVNPVVVYSSQDFYSGTFDDKQGADDFCIPNDDPSWSITNVDVVGVNSPSYQPNEVKVFFMAKNAGSLPGTGLYTNTVTGGGLLNATSGSFAMTLPSPALLAGNNCYWLSVQAVQPNNFFAGQTWQWAERTITATTHSPSAYRLPGKSGNVCQTWGSRLATCFPLSQSNPDFTYRLSGSIGTNYLTPQIASMSPTSGLGENVNLALTGLNFAQGAVISWTVDALTTVFTPTVIDGSHLTVTILAASVGPEGSTAIVQVVNPSPCLVSCVSNAKNFSLANLNLIYVPFVRR